MIEYTLKFDMIGVIIFLYFDSGKFNMAIPTYEEMMKPVLVCLQDRKIHSLSSIVEYCADYHHLTEEERNERLASGSLMLRNKVSWAVTYLSKAGLLEKVSRAQYRINNEGLKISQSSCVINTDYLIEHYPSFKEFKNRKKKDSTGNVPIQQELPTNQQLSPQEQIDNAISELNDALADDLMTEIMKISPYDFEKLIIKLLIAMGYGSMLDNQNAVTAKSGDEGIDGVLTADKFGFDSIYIQAKQWKDASTIGRPTVQSFAGAMLGKGATKGLFITTAKFSKDAETYARNNTAQKIVLVDGEALAKLMIEYDIGVYTIETYRIKKVDIDFFSDFE